MGLLPRALKNLPASIRKLDVKTAPGSVGCAVAWAAGITGDLIMPIQPENRKRYPKDWPQISLSIRERAGWKCEGTPQFPACRGEHGEPHPVTGSIVVLTVSHTDHTPENCDPANLRALCQRCHLNWDRPHHMANRQARKRREAATMELALTVPDPFEHAAADKEADDNQDANDQCPAQPIEQTIQRSAVSKMREDRDADQRAKQGDTFIHGTFPS
jgi:5-methylcytosine-specific restriction endonuclease McrA